MVLLRATLQLLGAAAKQAAKSILQHPFKPLFGFLFMLVTGLVEKCSVLLPGMAGGMILGLAMTFILAGFLALVNLIFESKRFSLQDSVSLTTRIFSPLINSLFILFIAKFLLQPVLHQVDAQLWLAIIFVTLFVLFNPLPEIVSRHGVGGVDAFKESFEFMKENGPEWVLAVVLLFSPLMLLSGPVFVLSLISSSDPLNVWFNLIRYTVLVTGLGANLLPLGEIAFPIVQFIFMTIGLYYVFFIFLFRFALFDALNRTTRRKRVYAASNG